MNDNKEDVAVEASRRKPARIGDEQDGEALQNFFGFSGFASTKVST